MLFRSSAEVTSHDFIGTPVVTPDKQRVGQITNLVFDQTGQLEIAVIGVGGVLGLGEKEVAVSIESLKSDTQNNKHVLVIDATKEQLKAAPSYKTLDDKALQERLANLREKAKEGWAKLKTKAGDAYDKAKVKAGEAYGEAKEKAGEAYDKAKEKAGEAYDKAKEKAGEAYDDAKAKVKEKTGDNK